jgi:hypothetical protein
VQVGKRPHCILPLAVAESSSGKKRLILDARVINLFVQYQRFHYEQLVEWLGNAQQGGFLTLKDLSAGYHHVYMAVEHWALLGFELEGEMYCFICLPFGLSQAPWTFTRLLEWVYQLPRQVGWKVTAMVDDSAWPTPSHWQGVWRAWCTSRLEAALGSVHVQGPRAPCGRCNKQDSSALHSICTRGDWLCPKASWIGCMLS